MKAKFGVSNSRKNNVQPNQHLKCSKLQALRTQTKMTQKPLHVNYLDYQGVQRKTQNGKRNRRINCKEIVKPCYRKNWVIKLIMYQELSTTSR